jgi:arsenate reductase-like glutaredoxin family protein
MVADPEMIRRPIVLVDGIVLVGFEDAAAGIP